MINRRSLLTSATAVGLGASVLPAFAIAACLSADVGSAHALAPPPPQPYLQGLDAAVATSLLARIKAAQTELRSGAPVTFMLLSGSTASHPTADISARDAFLALAFDHPLHIRRVEGHSQSWQPYLLAYAADEPGKMVWTVEVTTNWSGNIERVEMNFAPPPPF